MLFGVAIVASITGALVGFVIDFLLKEGQGMGAAGYRDHIVVCGWNSTARELIAELDGDDYEHKIVVIHDGDKNPAGNGVYFVSGDVTNADDLRRAGIEEAMAAVVCPADASNEADMRSILDVMAIESIAPQVRTVVEVNNPQHVEHFRRANADEIMVTSRIASRLLARSSLYPGLAEIVTDIVSGGEGSELYRVELPDGVHRPLGRRAVRPAARATTRRRCWRSAATGTPYVNPPADFRLDRGRRRRRGRRVAGHAGTPRGRHPGVARRQAAWATWPCAVLLGLGRGASREPEGLASRWELSTSSEHPPRRRRPRGPAARDAQRLDRARRR